MKLRTKIQTLDDMMYALISGNANSYMFLDEAIKNAQTAEFMFTQIQADEAKKWLEKAYSTGMCHSLDRPLFGIPFVLKDVFAQKGYKNQGASFALENVAEEEYDSMVVHILNDAGMYCMGRTNMSEFAFSGVGYNPHFGTAQNVWSQDEPLIPGGSSSGSAIAVAQGVAPVGIGSDTSGSIRIPAALNGLVGFKPTSMRISKKGMFALSPSLDTVGTMTHSVKDLFLLLKIFGFNLDENPKQKEKPEFVVPKNLDQFGIDKRILANFENHITKITKSGYSVEYSEIKSFHSILKLFNQYGTLVAIEAYMNLMPLFNKYGEKQVDPFILKRLKQQEGCKAKNFVHLLQKRSELMNQVQTEIDGRLLLMPTTAIRAVPIAEIESSLANFMKINKNILKLTMLGSFLDMPSLALPTGISDGAHPDSIMISGVTNSDEKVLFAVKDLAAIFTKDRPINNLRLSQN